MIQEGLNKKQNWTMKNQSIITVLKAILNEVFSYLHASGGTGKANVVSSLRQENNSSLKMNTLGPDEIMKSIRGFAVLTEDLN